MPILSDHYLKKTVIPAVVENGEIKCFYGKGPLPEIEDGTVLEIHVPSYTITSPKAAEILNMHYRAPFLLKGTILMVRLSWEKMSDQKPKGLEELDVWPPVGYVCRYAKVLLTEDLMIDLYATKKAILANAACVLCNMNNAKARSLNHAYSLLSRKYETKRITYGGNVFEAVYLFLDGRWQPLKELRLEVSERFELEIGAKLEALATGQKSLLSNRD